LVLFFAAASLAPPQALSGAARFRRGDVNATGGIEISDAVRVLGYLFLGAPAPPCLDAADADDDGGVAVTDAVYVLNYLFLAGAAPAAPHGECGDDPSGDGLSCGAFPPCSWGDFEEVRRSFGILETIAGKGATGDDTNDWQPRFEGGPAVEAELSTPHNALGDGAGNIYIADKDAHAIRRVGLDGKIVTVAGDNSPGDGPDEPTPALESQLNQPNGLWVRGDGTVYILDLGNQKIRRLDPDGRTRTLFAVPDLAIGRGLWVADDERLAYVTSGRTIVRWTPEDGPEVFADDFIQLGNLAVGPGGELLVTDRGAHRVYRVTADGEREPIAGNGQTTGGGDGQPALETGLNEVRGVWIHESGGIFLATHRGSQVWYVDTAGIIHLFIDGAPRAHAGDGEPFDSPGKKVSEVRNVTMDRQGNLLITEHDFGFIRRVRRVEGS
jgi:hypothetical protein